MDASDIYLKTATGKLYGTRLDPGGGPAPLALVIADAGPTDRDGNNPLSGRSDCLRLVAENLAAFGIASVRYDKRGVAASADAAPREEDLRFDVYVEDIRRWCDYLTRDAAVSRIVLIGHGEGGLAAILAAARTEVGGLVTLAASGSPADRMLRRQLAAAGLPDELRTHANGIIDSLAAGQPVGYVDPRLSALFRPSAQPYLISQFRHDPLASLRAVRCPVLVVQGTHDNQIMLADAEALVAARPGTALATFAGMNHVLKETPADLGSNIAAYNDPTLPLAAGLVARIAEFIEVRH